MKCLIVSACLLVGCAAPFQDWDRDDTIRQAAYSAVHVADWLQTKEIRKDDRYYETNPIMGNDPSSSAIDIYFGATLLGHTMISGFLKPEYRKYWQMVTICLESGVVAQNYRLGIRF